MIVTTKVKRKPGRPKAVKAVTEDSQLLKELQKTNELLNDIKLILDNMWRERRPT